MPRPKEFDPEDALHCAMEVFWDKGYEAASVRDLLDAMGINRGSMYACFGDKRELFLQSVRHYLEQMGAAFLGRLDEPGPVLPQLAGLLTHVAEGPRHGCLLTNTAVELAPHDDEVSAAVGEALAGLEQALARALQRAVEQGELADAASSGRRARFLVTVVQGLVVLRKAGTERAVLDDAAFVAMEALQR